jgi:hypothetical protein
VIVVVTTGCSGCVARVEVLRRTEAVDTIARPGKVWTSTTCARCQPTPPADVCTRDERFAARTPADVRQRWQGGRPMPPKTKPKPKPDHSTPPTPPVPRFLRRLVVKGRNR